MNNPIKEILQWAKEGGRVSVDGKNIWAGMGNRSGLHSYADQLISEKWEKSGSRFTKKVQGLQPGTEVVLKRFANINRDRGKWVTAGTITIANVTTRELQPSKPVLNQIERVLRHVFEGSVGIASVSLYTGSDNPFGEGRVWKAKDTDGDTYLFQDDPDATGFIAWIDCSMEHMGY